MKKLIIILFFLFFGLSYSQLLKKDQREVICNEFIELLKKNDYKKAVSYFDESLTSLFPDSLLQKAFESNTSLYGTFNKVIKIDKKTYNGYLIYECITEFKLSDIIIRIIFVDGDSTNKIGGLYFLPVQKDKSHELPTYINKGVFRELDTTFISSDGKGIDCSVSIPFDVEGTSAVIILSGSGPNDKDGTIGESKVYRDIAWGLASKGIVALRFSKRTLTYGKTMTKAEADNFTIQDEYITDALAAFDLVKTVKEIDTNHIYFIGHSLGNVVLGELAELKPQIAGLIELASPARGLEDIILEQMIFLNKLDSNNVPNAYLAMIKKQYDYHKTKLSKDSPKDSLLLGLNAKYWLSLNQLNHTEKLRLITKPILFSFGFRDYQVNSKEYDLWKNILKDNKNITFKQYNGLNHLFMQGEGEPNPYEYLKKNFVRSDVIDDIHQWIFSH